MVKRRRHCSESEANAEAIVVRRASVIVQWIGRRVTMASLGRATRRKSATPMHQSSSSSASASPPAPTTATTPATTTTSASRGFESFEALRMVVKSGHESSKELASVLQERADVELAYSKGLAKVSARLHKSGPAWTAAAEQMAAAAAAHRRAADALGAAVARPLRQLAELQHKTRKSVEAAVEKKAKMVADWRAREQKGQAKSAAAARHNERVQDGALDVKLGQRRNCSDKELSKMESKRRKSAEETRRADLVYYAACLKAERARLEWESSVARACGWMRHLERERRQRTQQTAAKYAAAMVALGPALTEASLRLQNTTESDVEQPQDSGVEVGESEGGVGELNLPSFYSEDLTNAMNRERRREALARLVSVVTADMERERKGKAGLENLAKALEETPKFGNDESKLEVTEKLQHIRSMLVYFDACRLKLLNAMLASEGRDPVSSHPSSTAIATIRDSKSGYLRSMLRLPFRSRQLSPPEWSPPPMAAALEAELEELDEELDDSEFDDFSDSEEAVNIIDVVNGVQPQNSSLEDESCERAVDEIVLENTVSLGKERLEMCVAIYDYEANMSDELSIRIGDRIVVFDKQPDGWWLGQRNHDVGIFPATYVQVEETHVQQ